MTTSTESRVIVSEGPCEVHGQIHNCVHHRDFPENWAQGETPVIAARYLLNEFERSLDSVGGVRRRETIEKAMADIEEFLARCDRERQDVVDDD